MMNILAGWRDKATKYIDVRLSLLKLGFIERTSTVLGFVMLSFIALFMLLAVLIFIGIGLQEAYSEWLDSRIAGAFLAAGTYLLLVILIVVLRKGIVNGFASLFVGIMTAQSDDEDEEKKAEEEGRKVPVE